MPRASFSWLALLLAMLSVDAARYARAGEGTAASNTDLRRIGLELAWDTQIEFDAAKGKLSGIAQHISTVSVQKLFEITHDRGRITVSERDLDPFGRPLGRDGAKRKADEWVARLQLEKPKTAPTVRELTVPDVVLVATSNRGTVQCINAETGNTLWATMVGSSRHPTLPPAVNEDFVAAINGSKLYLLNRRTGASVWERSTTNAPGAGPAMSETWIFVPMVNGLLERYDIESPKRPSEATHSRGRTMVQPVVFRDVVSWPTDLGSMYVGNSEAKGLRFRINTNDSIYSRPTFLPGTKKSGKITPTRMYFASADGYVYCAETDRGDIVQRFSAGEPIQHSPVVIQDQVYVITENDNLYCIGATHAEERWFVPQIRKFLAAGSERIYCLDPFNHLVAIDAKSGGRIGSVSLGNINFHYMNADSDRIYIGTDSGVLQCLREPTQHYPLVHSGVDAKKPPTVIPKAQQQDKPADDKPAEKMEAEDDPFGAAPAAKPAAKPAAEEDDPFAAPGEMKKDAKPAAADDDPFGS